MSALQDRPVIGQQRPLPKRALPIRAVRGLFSGFPNVTLIYQAPGPTGQMQDFQITVGPPLDDKNPALVRNPLGVAVLRMMEVFWEVEAERDTILKERDEALLQVQALQAEIDRLQPTEVKRGRPRGAER